MVNKKGEIVGCQCTPLEKEIGMLNAQFSSGLFEVGEFDERVKSLILRETFQDYRTEVLEAVEKVSNDLEKTFKGRYDVDEKTGISTFVEESQEVFKARCFREFENLMKGINNPNNEANISRKLEAKEKSLLKS